MRVKELIRLITKEVEEQTNNKPQIIDLRPAKRKLSWQPADDECSEVGAYLIGLGDDSNIYVSTGPEEAPMTEDDELLEDMPSLLKDLGASKREVEVFLEAILEALKAVR